MGPTVGAGKDGTLFRAQTLLSGQRVIVVSLHRAVICWWCWAGLESQRGEGKGRGGEFVSSSRTGGTR